jgi:hypothetical protein
MPLVTHRIVWHDSVLFLDELTECSPLRIESLRQPHEGADWRAVCKSRPRMKMSPSPRGFGSAPLDPQIGGHVASVSSPP